MGSSNPGHDGLATAEAQKLLESTRTLYWQLERGSDDDDYVTSFRVRGPRWPGDDYMMVLKKTDTNGIPMVAFHNATGLDVLMASIGGRLKNGTLKWVVDKYANGGTEHP